MLRGCMDERLETYMTHQCNSQKGLSSEMAYIIVKSIIVKSMDNVAKL